MKRIQLRHEIYFTLTRPQRTKFHSFGYFANTLEYIEMRDFLSITKNKDLIKKLIELKRQSMRLVA